MDSGYYAAMTGLLARNQALDTVAANLANAQTAGYRAERSFFRSALLGTGEGGSQLGHTVNDFGLLGGNALSGAQGALQATGNPLDVAVEGPGFFAVQTANGVRYTRDGSFHRSPTGLLLTRADEPVLSAAGQQISIPPGQVSVGADGVVSVAGGAVATLGIFEFGHGIALTPEGANRYRAGQDSKPMPAQAQVHQGALEASNQDLVQGTVELLAMQRQAEMMQKALTLFHVEFNKFASEELSRV